MRFRSLAESGSGPESFFLPYTIRSMWQRGRRCWTTSPAVASNLGVGTGSVPSDRPLKGIFAEPPELLDRFRESLEIILQLWEAEPPWRYEGKYWTVELADKWVDLEMGYPMRPYTQPHMPIGIPGFSPNSPSLFQAGKRGWYALSTNLTSNSVLGTHWATYKEGLEAGGHAVEPSGWRVAREVFVADTDKEALDYAVNGPMGETFRRYMLPLCAKNVPGGLGTFKDDPDMPDADVTVEYLAHNVWLVGSPPPLSRKSSASTTNTANSARC